MRGSRGSPGIRRRLAELSHTRAVNYDPAELELAHPPAGWTVTDRRQPLPPEPPANAGPGGSWEIARRLIRGYEFADPSIVRAFYDPDAPLAGRNMLLKLQALGLFHLFVGVRVGEVYDQTRPRRPRGARVWVELPHARGSRRDGPDGLGGVEVA